MHKLEAIKLLETKLAAIEQEHHAEFAGDEDMRAPRPSVTFNAAAEQFTVTIDFDERSVAAGAGV